MNKLPREATTGGEVHMPEGSKTGFDEGRRCLVLGGAALVGGSLLAAPYVKAQGGARQAIKVSVGRIPWAAGNSPMTQYMIANKLFEKRAAEFGYDLTIDWRDYPTAMPMVEAMVGNNIDIGMWGNTPIIRGISANLPITHVDTLCSWADVAAGRCGRRFDLAGCGWPG